MFKNKKTHLFENLMGLRKKRLSLEKIPYSQNKYLTESNMRNKEINR
jgi:hypothetical protein